MERDESLVIDLLVTIFGEPHAHYDNKSQISFDCPVCSYDIKVIFLNKIVNFHNVWMINFLYKREQKLGLLVFYYDRLQCLSICNL